ncbi:MAG: helix-turn-helix domain-containing protein [Mycobacterium sp.]
MSLNNHQPRRLPVPDTVRLQRKRLAKLHNRFLHWFSEHYDLAAIDVSLAAAAVERLEGDPLWLMLVAGSSTAKTETVSQFKTCANVHEISTLTSEAALLSASKKDDHDHGATGGLLRQIGDRGLLIIKDFTSILSMHPSTRGPLLAALREIYDGYWDRYKGSDGGSNLSWAGRITLLAAVTTAWDKHHAVIAEMGDRFVLLRIDSRDANSREAFGLKAMDNIAAESEYRQELRALVNEIVSAVDPTAAPTLTETERDRIFRAANLASYARTAVDTDYKGEVIDSHAPEGPARLAKQLTQLFRGLYVVGVDRTYALQLVIRCARDCLPPLRLQVLEHLADNPNSFTSDVRKGIQKPHATVDRVIQALVALGLVTQQEETNDRVQTVANNDKKRWRFAVAPDWDVSVLQIPEARRSGNHSGPAPLALAPGITGQARSLSSHSPTVKPGAVVTSTNAEGGTTGREF